MEKKEKIIELREKGYGYGKIAELLGISINTVKSFCRRNNITKGENNQIKDIVICPNCGEEINVIKKKRFCSNKCRTSYWSKNQDKINRKSAEKSECIMCKKEFIDYKRNSRKYCSRSCYIKHRFEGGGVND